VVGGGASGGSEARCWVRLLERPHPNLPPQAGEGVSYASRAASDALATPPSARAGGGWEGGVGR
jgi:hypothetical protein